MAYSIELTRSAFDDIDAIDDYISADSIENTLRWRNRLFARIRGVVHMPRACSFAPENDSCRIELRQFIYGRYRVIFTIRDEDSRIVVLAVRHGARQFLTADEIDDIE